MAVISKRNYPILWRMLNKHQIKGSFTQVNERAAYELNSEIFRGLNDVDICLVSDAFAKEAFKTFSNLEKLNNVLGLLPVKRFVVIFKGSCAIINIQRDFIQSIISKGDDLAAVYQLKESEYVVLHDGTNPSGNGLPSGLTFTYASLAILAFSELAEIKAEVLLPNKITKQFHCKYKNDLPFEVKNFSVNWFKESIQGHPFTVRGHWRMQVCGKGRSNRILKWIDPFVKNGYNKGAYMND